MRDKKLLTPSLPSSHKPSQTFSQVNLDDLLLTAKLVRRSPLLSHTFSHLLSHTFLPRFSPLSLLSLRPLSPFPPLLLPTLTYSYFPTFLLPTQANVPITEAQRRLYFSTPLAERYAGTWEPQSERTK